ncbi:MAG TPA: hypothetical protein VHQ22_05085 [Terriglobales bacterium]|nr:hypothetical protein [Terriglobales bacterium]
MDWFRQAGLVPGTTESHDEALREMVRQVRAKLLAAEVLVGLKKIDLAWDRLYKRQADGLVRLGCGRAGTSRLCAHHRGEAGMIG